MLHSNGDMKRKWTWAVDWLNGELERVRIGTEHVFATDFPVWGNSSIEDGVEIFFFGSLQRPYSTNPPYAYNNWSPPAQSNETSNGFVPFFFHYRHFGSSCEFCSTRRFFYIVICISDIFWNVPTVRG